MLNNPGCTVPFFIRVTYIFQKNVDLNPFCWCFNSFIEENFSMAGVLTPFSEIKCLKLQNMLELTLANTVVWRHFPGLGTWKNVSSDTDFKNKIKNCSLKWRIHLCRFSVQRQYTHKSLERREVPQPYKTKWWKFDKFFKIRF